MYQKQYKYQSNNVQIFQNENATPYLTLDAKTNQLKLATNKQNSKKGSEHKKNVNIRFHSNKKERRHSQELSAVKKSGKGAPQLRSQYTLQKRNKNARSITRLSARLSITRPNADKFQKPNATISP